jgi:predicted XRE-type DNA-binding protein
MGKKYKSVAELLPDISDDKEFNASVEKEINTKKISKMLFAMRCQAGLNQEQVAEKMHCTQGKVSKLENSYDTDISIGDLLNYCSAVNMRIELAFLDREFGIVDNVKCHLFRLKSLLDKLIEMSKGDETMERGVENFTLETIFNANLQLLKCLEKVKPKK